MNLVELGANVCLDGAQFGIETGDVLYPTNEYQIDVWTAINPHLGEVADGCIFRIRPHGSTRVVRVTSDESIFVDIPIRGKGWFLLYRDGQVSCESVDAEEGMGSFVYREEDVIVWIAGEKGLDVFNICSPPFIDDFEKPVAVDDSTLPSAFWEMYHKHKSAQ